MRSSMKMLMMNSRNDRMENNGRMESAGMNYGGMENEMEMRRRYRRDSRGRFRSEMDGGSIGMEGGYGGMEMNGNYGRSEMGEMESGNGGASNNGTSARMGGHPGRPFPVYEDGRSNMNQIGFNAGGHEVMTNYRMNATHHTGNEMEYRSTPKMGGGYASDMEMSMTRETAERWIRHMKHADGSKGPHWTMEEAKKIMEERKLRCDPYEFAAILNAMYSDYCKVLRKHGVESDDLYADLACAWLMDEDALPGKAMLYYKCIVEK